MAFAFSSAGESHGRGIISLISGVPAGFTVLTLDINRDLSRRQRGYGRGGRMKIESDEATILSGIRGGVTLGTPVCFLIQNKDWENWSQYLDPQKIEPGKELTRPRPGHADLAGGMKFGHRDLRNVLERASARETAARTAAGSLAKSLLAPFGIDFFGYVASIGGIHVVSDDVPLKERRECALESPFGTPNGDRDGEIREKLDEATDRGDTVGGEIEIIVTGLPPGLGSPAQWNTRLDGKLAAAIMSIPAIKGVEIGDGFRLAEKWGSDSHDEIFHNKDSGYFRKTNHAGGLEGGMTNGEPLIIRAAMKPIPTLKKSLASVDIITKEASAAAHERSDVCAVPAAAVVGEAMAALVLAGAFLEKFGCDNKDDIMKNYRAYRKRIGDF